MSQRTGRRTQAQQSWQPATDRRPTGGLPPIQGQGSREPYRKPSQMPPKEEKTWVLQAIRLRKGHFALIGGVVLALVIVIAVRDGQLQRTRHALDNVRADVADALQLVDERERQVRFSQTEEFIEREARERFGYLKPEEIRYLPDGTVITYEDAGVAEAAVEEGLKEEVYSIDAGDHRGGLEFD